MKEQLSQFVAAGLLSSTMQQLTDRVCVFLTPAANVCFYNTELIAIVKGNEMYTNPQFSSESPYRKGNAFILSAFDVVKKVYMITGQEKMLNDFYENSSELLGELLAEMLSTFPQSSPEELEKLKQVISDQAFQVEIKNLEIGNYKSMIETSDRMIADLNLIKKENKETIDAQFKRIEILEQDNRKLISELEKLKTKQQLPIKRKAKK